MIRRTVVAGIVLLFGWIPFSEALLVVGDSGTSSVYTDGSGAGSAWNYVGHLNQETTVNGVAASSATYVSNGWFVTANHVWTGDIKAGTTLDLGGTDYAIDLGSYTSITNANGTGADLCMFRVGGLAGLPTGMSVMETTPLWSDSIKLIGNGLDNAGSTGMTWGNGTLRYTGNGQSRQTYTSTLSLNGRDTTYYLSVYDNATTGSAYGQTYDSGGGVFVGDKLAGIMVAIGSGIGDGTTYISDFSVYGKQINSTLAIPEPAVLSLIAGFGAAILASRRIFAG